MAKDLVWPSAGLGGFPEAFASAAADEAAEALQAAAALMLSVPTQIEFLAAELARPEYAATRAVLARLAGKEPPHAE